MSRAIYNMAVRIIDKDVDGPYVLVPRSDYLELKQDHNKMIRLTGETRHQQNRIEHLEQSYRECLDLNRDGILAQMFDMQRELYDLNGMPNVDFSRPLGLRAQKVITEGIGDFTKSAIHECVELENWTQWKPWSRQLGNKSKIERWSKEHLHEMRMEVVDLLAFILNLCCLLGIDWKLLWKMYREKMHTNVYERHNSGVY